MFCMKCGSKLEDGLKFCTKCGAAVEGTKRENGFQSAKDLLDTAPADRGYMNKRELPQREISQKAPKTKKKKKNNKSNRWIALILLVVMFTLAVGGCVFGFKLLHHVRGDETGDVAVSLETLDEETSPQASMNEEILNAFSADEVYFPAGEENIICFTVQAADSGADVYLYDENGKLAKMYDDGKNGDETAGDGIYSVQVEVSKEQTAKLRYYAQADGVKSNEETLYFFAQPTDEEAEQIQEDIQNIKAALREIEQGYCDEDGYIETEDMEDALSEMEAYVQTLYEDGSVIWYERNSDNLMMKFSCGITFAYTLSAEGFDSGEEDVEVDILTLQPCQSTYPAEVSDYMLMPDMAAEELAENVQNCSYLTGDNYDDDEVTLALIKSFFANEIVLWHGHGNYSASLHSYLVTGEDFDWRACCVRLVDREYRLDCVQNRIIVSSNGKACITSKYIEKYCNDLSGSFYYLAACSSGKDSVLADAFLNKGAAAVVGNSDTIRTVYNILIESATADYLGQIKAETNYYHTLQEALKEAKALYGENDTSFGGCGAYPIIFGGETALGYRVSKHNGLNESAQENTLDDLVGMEATYLYNYDFDLDGDKETLAIYQYEDEWGDLNNCQIWYEDEEAEQLFIWEDTSGNSFCGVCEPIMEYYDSAGRPYIIVNTYRRAAASYLDCMILGLNANGEFAIIYDQNATAESVDAGVIQLKLETMELVDGANSYSYETKSAYIENGEVKFIEITLGENLLYQQHTYMLFNDEEITTWEEAKDYCERLGGHLAVISSEEENEAVFQYMISMDCQSAYFGYSDAKEEGTWVWVNGETSSYTNWHTSEPNSENSNEDYAMFYYKYSDGTWNDGDFANKTVSGGRSFICEWDYEIVSSDTETADDYILPKSDSDYLTEADLEALTAEELRLARNEIYARHGRIFTAEDLNEYFSSKSWYTPTYAPEEFDQIASNLFNQYEMANLELIISAEEER